MQFGLTLPNFHYGAAPTRDHILDVARAAEASGFTSVWASDHILVGSKFPRYGTLFEALTTLGWVGAQTERIQVGTSILVLPLRNAILAAKQLATIDALTNGRVLVGVGVGWIESEYGFLGADFRRRGRVLDEAIRVMRNLWTSDRSGFSGEFYQYEDALFFPKPARPGGPPIWIGGNSDAAITRAATLGDGWHADEVAPDEFATKTASLQQQAAANGRAAEATIRYTVDLYGATGTARAGGKTTGPQLGDDVELGMAGSFDGMRAYVRRYRDLGTSHFVCQFEHATPEEHVSFIRTFGREVIARL